MLKMAGALGALCLLLFLVYKVWRLARKNSLKKIDAHRKPYSREAFISYMEQEHGAGQTLSGTVYDTTREFLPYHDFTIYPADDLHHVFGFTRNQVKDLMTDVCLHLSDNYPSEEELQRYARQYSEINTLEKMIVFLHKRKGN